MKAKISATLLKRLEPQEKPYEIVDTELRGFLLRVQPSGSMTYYARYRLRDGQQNRVKLGSTAVMTPAQARDEAKQKLAEAVKGDDPGEARRSAKTDTLRSYLDGPYKDWVEANLRTGSERIKRLKCSISELLDRRLDLITGWDVEKWRAKRLKEVRANGKTRSEATINRDIAYLKSAFSKAVEWGLLSEHPLNKVKLAREDSGRIVRYLSQDERSRLIAALNAREERLRVERDSANEWRRKRGYEEYPDLRKFTFADFFKPMVLLSLHTGLRRGELFSLGWQDVDLARAVLTVRGQTAKSGKTRHVPLNATAHKLLSAWKTQLPAATGLVFASPKTGQKFDNVTKTWKSLLAEANITEFRWHDMRHDFASQLVMAGIDLNTVRELLGHADLKMTLRYAHLAPEHKAQAVAALDRVSTEIGEFGVAAQ